MKTTLIWIAAMCVVSAASFYGGMCRAAYLMYYPDGSHSRALIEMLKAGQTAEATRYETNVLDSYVAPLHSSSLSRLPSPLIVFSCSPDPEHRGLLLTARDLHAKYPDLTFHSPSLAAIAKFEEAEPYGPGSTAH